MKKIEDLAGYIFIISVAVLTVISMLGVWDFFSTDVIWKSIQTLGLLALVAVVVLVAGKFFEKRGQDELDVVVPNPTFKIIRQITVTVLIISASFLALLGVFAIWEVIKDKDVLYKSLSSVGLLAFGAFIIVMTALEREGSPMMRRERSRTSAGGILLVIFIVYLVFAFSRFSLFSF